jgi:hypothetical protein
MFIESGTLSPVSNREDWYEQVTFNDMDDGSPVLLNFTQLAAANPNGFVSNLWTVVDGSIMTSSLSTLTIPGYPIGSQLTAFTLTVGTGLNILVGDWVRITDTSTGLNSISGIVTSYSSGTGALVIQACWTFQFEIRRMRRPNRSLSGFGPGYDFGVYDEAPLIIASLGNGITILDTGTILIWLLETQLKPLSEGSCMASMTMTNGTQTRQVFRATLPILRGGVTN